MTEPSENSTTMVVDPDRNLLRVTLEGRYDLRDWLEVIQAVGMVEGYEPGMDALHDARDAYFDFTHEDVRILTDWVRGRMDVWGSRWRYATVVSTDLMYGLSRMVASWFADAPFEASVFRSMEAAEAWIAEGRSGREG